MASVEEKLSKLREERIAREKARIEKLRELNLKKYNKNDTNTLSHSVSKIPSATRTISSNSATTGTKNNVTNTVKNNFHVNGTTKRTISAPVLLKKPTMSKEHNLLQKPVVPSNLKQTSCNNKSDSILNVNNKSLIGRKPVHLAKNIPNRSSGIIHKAFNYQNVNSVLYSGNAQQFQANRKSLALGTSKSGIQSKSFSKLTKPNDNKKSVQPTTVTQSASKTNPKRISVFERLYRPKIVPKVTISDAQKLRADPTYLKKVIENSSLITGKRHTISQTFGAPVRRSISAVHLKRASKSELKNCIHTWASIGEKLDKVNMNEVDEDDCIQCEKVVSAVKSERKKVKFQTPVSIKFNTPRPEELQARLQKWLQKRGKSVDSYHHLQCFGIFHLSKDVKPLETPKFELYDEENKENIALESDSDDQSYTENVNDQVNDFAAENKVEIGNDKWRRASYVSDSLSFNDSKNTTLTSADDLHHVDELLLGALNDLTELLREGFDWEQCARWLRAIRERFPSAPESAAYWECRAALEEHRGDLPASMQCWEEAIAMGTERSIVEANLDQLLDKFMQLKISPSSGRHKQVDPKMVDVKNVLKSTIIRFAVQKAKLTPEYLKVEKNSNIRFKSSMHRRQSNQNDPPKYTVTPVRRSARLSVHGSTKRTPLQVCSTVSQAESLGHPVVFIRNEKLFGTP